jgi:uncharacterized protein (TIGR04255 family)
VGDLERGRCDGGLGPFSNKGAHVVDYEKPILVEIYTETYIKSGQLPSERFFDIVPALRELGLSKVEFGHVDALSVQPAERIISQSRAPRVRCWDKENHKLVQVGQDLLVINVVGTYPGWEEYVDFFERVQATARRAIPGLEAQSLALHAIDRFDVDKAGYKLADYLAPTGRIIPEWYLESQEAIDIDMGRGLLHSDGYNRVVNVKVRPGKKRVKIELRSTFHENVSEDHYLGKVLESLHRRSISTFEAMITDRTRNEIMGGLK